MNEHMGMGQNLLIMWYKGWPSTLRFTGGTGFWPTSILCQILYRLFFWCDARRRWDGFFFFPVRKCRIFLCFMLWTKLCTPGRWLLQIFFGPRCMSNPNHWQVEIAMWHHIKHWHTRIHVKCCLEDRLIHKCLVLWEPLTNVEPGWRR